MGNKVYMLYVNDIYRENVVAKDELDAVKNYLESQEILDAPVKDGDAFRYKGDLIIAVMIK